MDGKTGASKNTIIIIMALALIIIIGVVAYTTMTGNQVGTTSPTVSGTAGLVSTSTSQLTTPIETTTNTTSVSTNTYGQAIIVTDFSGRQVSLHQPAKRIIVLSPSLAEILYTIGAGEEVIAIDNDTMLDEYLPSSIKENVIANNTVDQVLSLNPDLIIVDIGYDKNKHGDNSFLEELEKQGVPVLELSTSSLNNTLKSIEILGKVTGREDNAEKLKTFIIDRYERIRALSEKVTDNERLRVVVVDGSSILGDDKELIVHVDTLWGQLVEDAGAVNIALRNYPGKDTLKIGFNILREWDPDAIIIISGIGEANKVLDAIEHDELWHGLRAYTSNRIYVVSSGSSIGDVLGYGPRTIIGVEYVASLLYPNIYDSIDWRQDMEFLLREFYDTFIPKQAFAAYNIRWKEIVDTLNNKVRIPREPKRIVDFISYVTMTAFNAFDRIVGVSKYAKKNPLVTVAYPNITNKPSPGSSFSVNIEELSALNPDLVVIWPYKKDVVEEIETIGIPVVEVKLYSINDIYRLVWMIGSILDERERARELVDSMNSLIGFVEERVSKIPFNSRARVLYLWSKPTKVQGGKGTVNDFIELAGGVNVVAQDLPDKTYVEVDLEDIVKWNPDVIVLWYYARYNESTILNDPVLQDVKAVAEGKVYREPYYEHWGVDCSLFILWLAWKLYPEKFSDIDFYAIADKYYEDWYGVKYSVVAGVEE